MTGTEAPVHDGAVVDVASDELPGPALLSDEPRNEPGDASGAAVEVDAVGAAAVDLAREAAESEAAGLVGEHLGADADEARVVTHYFATLDPGYVGWRWAVTVARASRAKNVTVDDVVLLPGADAVLAPEWLPWSERLRPGDLGAGDLLPTSADDPRLIAAYFSTEDADEAAIGYEVGLGRERVLSYDGMLDAVDRWYAGAPGPRADVAKVAPASCATCGFFVPLAGGLRQAFGACANGFAPDDGKVVAVDHGCGAHSEAVVVPISQPPPPPLIDEAGYDIVDPADLAAIEDLPQPEVVDVAEEIDVPEAADAAEEAGLELPAVDEPAAVDEVDEIAEVTVADPVVDEAGEGIDTV
ncbi:MAG TPA: DUF3027 domain-containing protein [Mycobacteriales bacterium]|nr:DUF3027 domain-containing protein [Mycobacteriales bacterium]